MHGGLLLIRDHVANEGPIGEDYETCKLLLCRASVETLQRGSVYVFSLIRFPELRDENHDALKLHCHQLGCACNDALPLKFCRAVRVNQFVVIQNQKVQTIVLGLAGIWRAEYLFDRLNKRAGAMTEEFLRQAIRVVTSYASFTRALQGVELLPGELPKDGAFALLTTYHLQKLLHSDKFTPSQLAELRQLTREQVEKSARQDAELLINSNLAKLKDGVELNPDLA